MPDYRTFAISTFDNPFNPFEDFDNWFLYDCEKDYYSLTKVARLAKVDDSMTEKEYAKEVERAIERLIEIDPLDIYVKVYKPGFEPKTDSTESNDDSNKGFWSVKGLWYAD